MLSPPGAMLPYRPLSPWAREPYHPPGPGRRLRRCRRGALEPVTLPEMPNWFQPVTTVGLVVAFIFSRTLLGIPPRGRLPSLNAWLRRAPPRPRPLGSTKLPGGGAAEARDGELEAVELRPATSLESIWDAYLFAGSFSDIPVALQLVEFPQAFLDWRRSNGLIPGLPNRPAAIDPIFDRRELPSTEDDVVRVCDEMLDSYGGVLLALQVSETSPTEELVGTVAVRVKWLPQGCHVREVDGHLVVERHVPYGVVASTALGLEPVAYLEQFAVAERWRGRGLAQRMLRYAEDLARQWNLRLLALHVQRDDWAPLRFYQKSGFEITSDWMGRGPQRFLLIKIL